jgi:hypothetical protein|tara:strand:+ start:1417 stop:1599 length:183 start_codon:yes stop_codon:yes gene_type:complete
MSRFILASPNEINVGIIDDRSERFKKSAIADCSSLYVLIAIMDSSKVADYTIKWGLIALQ